MIFLSLLRTKIAIVLVAACFTAVAPQEVTVNCDFQLSIFDEYSCVLEGITVLDPLVSVIFGGTHQGNRGNEDVEFVRIHDSLTPFMIQSMFATFPNMVQLSIESSGLQSIDIPESARLHELDLYGNNITRIESGSIRNQTELLSCYLDRNGITEIDEDAFVGIPNVSYLVLTDNLLTQLAPGTFSPLSELIFVSFVENLVTRIGPDHFTQNTKLQTLYASFNRINAISPQFADSFRQTATYISLVGNVCTDHHFAVSTEEGWNDMVTDLQSCFSNFNNGTGADTQRITMEFTGPLTIMDESGNVLATINN